MVSAVSFFNPWADKGTLKDLSRIPRWQKTAAIAFTVLESIATIYLANRASRVPVYVILPVVGLFALATFRALVAYFAPPEPLVVQKKGMEIMKEQCRALIEASLKPTGRKLGIAVDNGDCFYHTIAQLLQKEGIDVSVVSLRNEIDEALRENPKWEAYLREKVRQDPRGIGSFEVYRSNVAKTADQMVSQGPIWGDANREGVILCEKYRFNLEILKAGFIDSKITQDQEIQSIQRVRDEILEKFADSPLLQKYDEDIQTLCRAHYNNPANYYTDEEIVPKDGIYPKTLTIALFGDHFVPVFSA